MIYPRNVVVPTDDELVIKYLRDLDEPKCYFGEGPAERRERLSRILAKLSPEERSKFEDSHKADQEQLTNDNHSQIFYYEGSEALKRARYEIADYSIKQCNYRLDMARIKQLEAPSANLPQEIIERLRGIEDLGSYIDDNNSTTELKTLTSCNLNPNATHLATSCRSGRCTIWSLPDMDSQTTLKGHDSNASFISFSPKSGIDLDAKVANLASCSMDGSVILWSLVDEAPISKLSGPQNWRVSRLRYHPSGIYLGTCCSDGSWRLWDIQSETELIHQEGHADAVFDMAYHPDGSLAGTASMDSYSRVWDLRTGRSILFLEGHTGGIRTIDFSPDGYHMATGGIDNSVRIWNLRQQRVEYTIPAHLNAVTTVMFEKENGHYLASGSFDRTIRFWSSRTWAPIKALDAFDDKVTNFDISKDSNYVAACYSRFTRLWTINSG